MHVGSLILKLGREIESIKMLVLQVYNFTYLSVVIASLYMKEDDDPFFLWKVGDWFSKWKGGKRFTYASTVFLYG